MWAIKITQRIPRYQEYVKCWSVFFSPLRISQCRKVCDMIMEEKKKYVGLNQIASQTITELMEQIKVLENENEIQRSIAISKDRYVLESGGCFCARYSGKHYWKGWTKRVWNNTVPPWKCCSILQTFRNKCHSLTTALMQGARHMPACLDNEQSLTFQ